MGSIIELAKDAYELAKKGMTVELQERIMEVREQAIELQEENLKLRTELLALKTAAEEEKTLEWDEQIYWKKLPDDNKDGPYCPTCWDNGKKLVRLQKGLTQHQTGAGQVGFYECIPSGRRFPRLFHTGDKRSRPYIRS